MKKIILISALAILVLIIALGAWFSYSMTKPLYQPGMVGNGDNLRAPLSPPEQPDDETFWLVEPDIQLYHFSEGQGRPVLIVHGGPGIPGRETWPGLTPLSEQFQFNYYDQRGSGDSSRPIDTFESQNYSQNTQALDQALGFGAQLADIERIRQILGEDRLILIGHSFGAFFAAMYASEFPDNVEALVLIAPADMLVMPQKSGGLFEAVRERLPEEERLAFDDFLKEYLSYGDMYMKSEADLVAMNQKLGEYYQLAMDVQGTMSAEPGGWMVNAIYMSMGLRHDYTEALGAVDAPVLVLHGAHDLQSEETSYAYVDALPNASFYVFEQATHFPFFETPEEFAEVVGEFLAEFE